MTSTRPGAVRTLALAMAVPLTVPLAVPKGVPLALAMAVPLVFPLAGCGAVAPESAPGAESDTVVTVFAAASLTDVFAELEKQFEAEHPGVDVVVNFGGSSALAEQLVNGAPAQVFAAASDSTMAIVVDAEIASDPKLFATNTLRIAVPAGNPAGIEGLDDFARDDLLIALCAVEAPCGAVAAATFDVVGITPAPDTLEQDVRAVLTKVLLGEVDAGLVYSTDVLAAGPGVEGIDITGIDIAAGASVALGDAIVVAATTEYPIATLEGAGAAATDFVNFVLGDTGVRILTKAGFGSR